MEKYICIHGHFYQPPRENPWLERIELQDSASPYHDWNQRITAECYEPNLSARILGQDFKIIDIYNNYTKISFNFGPTLLYEMEMDRPDVYRGIIDADRAGAKAFSGHGPAIAQVYNHMIMPLASMRDRHTQVKWGIRDFEHRFGRAPEGMWLPETAADTASLEVLAENGIRFTILAPRQAKRVRKIARNSRWKDVTEETLDTAMPYLCMLPSGRSIAIFFYNGAISQEVSFGNLLDNGEHFAKRLSTAFPADDGRAAALVHIATDGESYGHHHKHGDMALSYCIHSIETNGLASLTNYGEFLEKFPPDTQVEIHDNSSWSCIHGVERWKADCGCNSGRPGWNQKWREPLREALDWLKCRFDEIFEYEGAKYLKDPWAARDRYVDVINDRSVENVEVFFSAHSVRPLSKEDKVRTLKLMCMQRNSMLMYTSCGWFFDEVSGIETVQVMQYASRAVQLAYDVTGRSFDEEFALRLASAPSNIYTDGRYAYENFAKPARVDLLRAGAHHAISALFDKQARSGRIYCFVVENEFYEKTESGKLKLAIGRSHIKSEITWEEAETVFVVLHLGETNVNCGIKYNNTEEFSHMESELLMAFERGDIPQVIRVMDRLFPHNFSLWHLFKDDQRRVINFILDRTYKDIESSYRHIYEDKYNIMDFLGRLYIPLPKPLRLAAEYILNFDIKESFNSEAVDLERLNDLIKSACHLSVAIDPDQIGYFAGVWVNQAMERLKERPGDAALLSRIRDVLKVLSGQQINMNLWRAQNIYFSIGKEEPQRMLEEGGEKIQWAEAFAELGNILHIRVR